MITKLYNYLKQNIKFFILLIFLFFIFTIELPFYIDAPGGLLDVKTRVEVSDSYDVAGSFNLAYVTELRATIPTLIYSYFNKNWNVVKKDEVVASNETIEENEYRNQIMLTESKENAMIVGFTKASKEVSIKNRKIYVTYVSPDAITNLKIKDQIISINNKKITSKEDIYVAISESDKFNIEVINEGKRYIRTAEKRFDKIGIMLSETKDVKTPNDVKFNFKSSESGPSGGFMMSLAIYNYLTEEDITHGLKIVGTGTINEDGSVGAIGGIEYKIKGAVKNDADLFFVPYGNYEEALKVKSENNFNINLVCVNNIDDAINYLKGL